MMLSNKIIGLSLLSVLMLGLGYSWRVYHERNLIHPRQLQADIQEMDINQTKRIGNSDIWIHKDENHNITIAIMRIGK